jgi:hypothetical protein
MNTHYRAENIELIQRQPTEEDKLVSMPNIHQVHETRFDSVSIPVRTAMMKAMYNQKNISAQ